MKEAEHPKVLTGAKLKKVDNRGEFWFSTDEGIWRINPDMLVGITYRDLYATGKLVRLTKNGKDKYQWVEDVEDKSVGKTQQSIEHNGLSKGLSVGKSIVGKLFKKGV
jgi:hypothetical protein